MKRFFYVAALSLLTAVGAQGAEKPSPGSVPNLTIYHLEGRRSERIVWLCEELGRPYKLEFKPGSLGGSLQAIREVNPLMPVAPTVIYGDQVVVESGAIIELILAREGKGRLVPPVDSPDYAYYLQWMHFAEGSYASHLLLDYRLAQVQGRTPPRPGPKLVDTQMVIKFTDDFLAKHPYFGGKEFSAADIMMTFIVNYSTLLNLVDFKDYPHLTAWLKKMESRPAYQRMVKVSRPNGMLSPPEPLK